jgi:hypothetical protein
MQEQIAIGSSPNVVVEPLRYIIEEDRPPERATKKLLEYMHRIERPAFVGSVAIEIGWSIDRTMEMLERFVHDGAIRWATQDELYHLSAPKDAFAIVVVDKSKFGTIIQ